MLWEQGMNPANLVYLLRSILAERESQQTQRDALVENLPSAIDLVWTGDEILGASGRDTRVVVQERSYFSLSTVFWDLTSIICFF
jgi:hypothetical protein